jgi:hypothetical protein
MFQSLQGWCVICELLKMHDEDNIKKMIEQIDLTWCHICIYTMTTHSSKDYQDMPVATMCRSALFLLIGLHQ